MGARGVYRGLGSIASPGKAGTKEEVRLVALRHVQQHVLEKQVVQRERGDGFIDDSIETQCRGEHASQGVGCVVELDRPARQASGRRQ